MTPTEQTYKRVYCLYRVSTKGQVDKDDIPMQKQSCREFAKRHNGWVIKKEFQEKGVSGFKISAQDRDAIQEIKSAAERHEFDILLVFMFDRIGRIDNETPFVVEWFINHGIEVWSVNEGEQKMESHVDKLMNYIRFWQANGESKKTSIRVKARLQQLVEEGVYTGGTAPFGYNLVKSGVVNKKGKELMTLEQNPIEAEMIKSIYEKTANEGLGTYVLAQYLNNKGMRTHKGIKFQASTINRILQNEIYRGFYVRGGTRSKRIEELQIVSDAMFNDVQMIMEQRKLSNEQKTQMSRFTRSSAMLGGNVYCAHCGAKLSANSFMDRYRTKDGELHIGSRRYRYMCTGKAMHRNDCDGQSVYVAKKVEDVVIETIHQCFKKLKTTPKDAALEKKYQAEINQLKKEVREIRKTIDTNKRKLSELNEEIANTLLGESKFTPESLSAAIEIIKQKLDASNELLVEKEKQVDLKKSDMGNVDYYYDQFSSWADEFDEAPQERKRLIICKLFKEINVGKNYQIEMLMDTSYQQFIQ